MYKSKSWKAGQRKGEYGSVHSYSKTWFKKRERERERKLWTKGKKRHKRRWIIQYAPLVDSFVILYNGPLEKNQVIAWKRSLFLSHHALMLGKKNNLFLAKMSNVHIDEPQNVQSQNDHSNNFYYHYNDKKNAHNWCTRFAFWSSYLQNPRVIIDYLLFSFFFFLMVHNIDIILLLLFFLLTAARVLNWGWFTLL